jgi:glycosyltransferase involved in cell wall biosynthesis
VSTQPKILLVAPLPPPYGGISHWTSLVLAHAGQDKRVNLRVLDISVRWRSVHDTQVWKRTIGGVVQLLRDFVLFVWQLLAFRPVAVHLITSGSIAVFRDLSFLGLCRLLGIRSCYHIRFGRIPQLVKPENGRSVEARAIALACRLATKVIAIDAATYDALPVLTGKDKLELIPNCYDPAKFPAPGESLPRKVVYLGWLIPAKGLRELAAAWAELKPASWTLQLVGPGDEDFIREIKTLAADSHIELTGGLSHAAAMEHLARASIFVLPSHTEGFPNVVLEAMALGKPIVATRVGAIPEMLSTDAGIVIEKENVLQLVAALRQLIDHDALRSALGDAAAKRAAKLYSIHAIYDRYVELWLGNTTGNTSPIEEH